MLKFDSLPVRTRRVYDFLSADSALQGFTLIGGTALALQIGHRQSEDLDLWIPAEHLNKRSLAELISKVKAKGVDTRLVMSQQQVSAAKINGTDLLAHVQDYLIDGVKVTFFARADPPYQYFSTLPRVAGTSSSFQIMDADGLFSMKSWVIHQRVRSRDLYDLKTFMEQGKTLDDIFLAASAADPTCLPEYAQSVLTGEVPLDKKDEGFNSIGVTDSIHDIYGFFKTRLDEYEQLYARAVREEIPMPDFSPETRTAHVTSQKGS
ncbi:hypothetical protein FACS1894116_09140 [Betaproteobacteria bacterium]|nr:hypothetical protein FACS1894116_09140 [Betaproteobacteria bacterium]GHT99659.1 hypothetical protein FACS1894154_07170 [Betaproteobacteria bacterium]GHU24365.1 hypothetical protein FACS189488_08840 [Betaproteobacteria bacterium]